MPLTVVDEVMGFWPGALPLYLSLWIYLLLPLALLRDRAQLLIYGRAVVGIAIIGIGTFLVRPTAVPVSAVDWSLYPSIGFLKTVDAAGNACPSLHVAFAAFSAVWLHRILREMRARGGWRIASALWCVGIVYSTLATKQHVFWDVLAGLALGVGGAFWPFGRAHRQPVARNS